MSNKALTSNVATLTTSAAHGFSAGASVIVAGVDATFNGTYTIATVPSTTTFTFAKTASNLASAVAAGTVRGPSLFSNSTSLASRVVVAGGGGGGGGVTTGTGAAGGAGGGLIAGTSTRSGATSPTAGTQSAGNALGIGGNAASTSNSGGGGGGYWGGGVSAGPSIGGAGGSSWTAAQATSVTHTQAYRAGAGQILLTYRADTTGPTVVDVTSTMANGAYRFGTTIPILVNFTEPVSITGSPTLTLGFDAGSTRSSAVLNYLSGSGTSSLVFTYPIAVGDIAADLDYASTTALALNGGTIADATGNAGDVTLPATGSASSLAGTSNLLIDASTPVIPTMLAASGIDSIFLDWTDNLETDLKEYRVYSCSSLTALSCSSTSSFSVLSSVAQPTSEFDHFAVGRGITYYYYVTAIDIHGNESLPSSIVSWTLPIPAVITTPSVSTATPTNDTTPDVTGSADPGVTVTVYIDGVAQSPTVTVAGDGSYTFTPSSPLSAGDHVFTARATATVNGKQNSSGTSQEWTATIDTTSPRVSTIARFNPASATTSADSLTFRVVFDSVVTGVSAADFAVTGTTATVTSVTPVAGLTGG